MMLILQTQDSAESLGLLLKELYDYTKAKSIIDADTVFPLLLVADKYNVKTVLLRCTQWLDGIDSGRLSYTLLRVSPAKGKGHAGTCKTYRSITYAVLTHTVFVKGRLLMLRDCFAMCRC